MRYDEEIEYIEDDEDEDDAFFCIFCIFIFCVPFLFGQKQGKQTCASHVEKVQRPLEPPHFHNVDGSSK